MEEEVSLLKKKGISENIVQKIMSNPRKNQTIEKLDTLIVGLNKFRTDF